MIDELVIDVANIHKILSVLVVFVTPFMDTFLWEFTPCMIDVGTQVLSQSLYGLCVQYPLGN